MAQLVALCLTWAALEHQNPAGRVQPFFRNSHHLLHPDLSEHDISTITPPCADPAVLYTATMAREPEPLDRVRALVCEPCWVKCFDTEEFEKLGRGEIDKIRYSVSVVRGHYAMTCMIQSVYGLRLRQLHRTPNKYNVG